MSTDSSDTDESKYVLSLDNNDLIVYTNISHNDEKKKFICKACIKQGTKRTKRLAYALKSKGDLSIRIKQDNTNINKIKLFIKHPLFDDDIYVLKSNDSESDKSESESEESDKILETNEPDDKKIPLSYIYILELEETKYYIGKSSKPLSRTGEHLISTIHNDASCSGSAWTAMYPPVKVLRVIISYDEFDEDLYTLRYMRDHGIDNVRGGSFCELNLSHDNVVTLEKMLAGAGDKCYYCGASDHYVAACPQKKIKRVTQKRKQVVIKTKDIPKSRILKLMGTTKLMQNSDIKIENLLKPENKSEHKTEHKTENKNKCKFCGNGFDTSEKLKTHETIICKKSSIVQKGKHIEANVDAILAANKKYLDKKF
jgi:hypothetical protein